MFIYFCYFVLNANLRDLGGGDVTQGEPESARCRMTNYMQLPVTDDA